MDFSNGNLTLIILIIILACSWVYITKKEKDRDLNTDYSKVKLGGVFQTLPEGGTGLYFKYDKRTQQKKKNYILKNYLQGIDVSDEYGYVYKISELLNEAYYKVEHQGNGNVKSKIGPYIVYKVIPKTELGQSTISIDNPNGPVQVIGDNSSGFQYNGNGNDFAETLYVYKDLMIDKGISSEDINIVLEYPNDNDVKKSFLSKYGLDLAKITIDIGGTIVSLLSLLKN